MSLLLLLQGYVAFGQSYKNETCNIKPQVITREEYETARLSAGELAEMPAPLDSAAACTCLKQWLDGMLARVSMEDFIFTRRSGQVFFEYRSKHRQLVPNFMKGVQLYQIPQEHCPDIMKMDIYVSYARGSEDEECRYSLLAYREDDGSLICFPAAIAAHHLFVSPSGKALAVKKTSVIGRYEVFNDIYSVEELDCYSIVCDTSSRRMDLVRIACANGEMYGIRWFPGWKAREDIFWKDGILYLCGGCDWVFSDTGRLVKKECFAEEDREYYKITLEDASCTDIWE